MTARRKTRRGDGSLKLLEEKRRQTTCLPSPSAAVGELRRLDGDAEFELDVGEERVETLKLRGRNVGVAECHAARNAGFACIRRGVATANAAFPRTATRSANTPQIIAIVAPAIVAGST